MACDLALDAGDKIGAIKAHCILDRLAKRNKVRRACVHDYGNRIQRLICQQWLDAEEAEAWAEAAIDSEAMYSVQLHEVGGAP